MAVIRGTVNLADRQTFFVRHGDIVGRLCVFLFLLLLLALGVKAIRGEKTGDCSE